MSEIVEIIERTNKIINASGVVIEVANPNLNYIVSESIPIIPSERLQITASGDYAHYIYAFYTAEGVFISGFLAEAGGTVTEILAEEVVAPENAASMLIAYKKPKQGIVVRLDVTPSDGNIKMQKIEDLPEATELNDTDISILNTTTPQTKKFKISTLVDYIKGKFESWSFILKTSAQTIPAAIDELKNDVDEIDTDLISGFTPLSSATRGQLKLPNGYMSVWGVVPLSALTTSPNYGGLYTTTIDLNSYGFLGNSMSTAVPRYPGHPKISHTWDDASKMLTLVSDVNVSGGFVNWMVIGAWK